MKITIDTDESPMTAAEQLVWASVFAKYYDIQEIPPELVKSWCREGAEDDFWEAQGEWEDTQALIAIERASAAVIHIRKVQGVAEDSFVTEIVGR